MITLDHLQEAKARLDEISTLTGYPVNSDEWLEYLCGEVGDIDAAGLRDFTREAAATRIDGIGAGHIMAGALIALLARKLAFRDLLNEGGG